MGFRKHFLPLSPARSLSLSLSAHRLYYLQEYFITTHGRGAQQARPTCPVLFIFVCRATLEITVPPARERLPPNCTFKCQAHMHTHKHTRVYTGTCRGKWAPVQRPFALLPLKNSSSSAFLRYTTTHIPCSIGPKTLLLLLGGSLLLLKDTRREICPVLSGGVPCRHAGHMHRHCERCNMSRKPFYSTWPFHLLSGRCSDCPPRHSARPPPHAPSPLGHLQGAQAKGISMACSGGQRSTLGAVFFFGAAFFLGEACHHAADNAGHHHHSRRAHTSTPHQSPHRLSPSTHHLHTPAQTGLRVSPPPRHLRASTFHVRGRKAADVSSVQRAATHLGLLGNGLLHGRCCRRGLGCGRCTRIVRCAERWRRRRLRNWRAARANCHGGAPAHLASWARVPHHRLETGRRWPWAWAPAGRAHASVSWPPSARRAGPSGRASTPERAGGTGRRIAAREPGARRGTEDFFGAALFAADFLGVGFFGGIAGFATTKLPRRRPRSAPRRHGRHGRWCRWRAPPRASDPLREPLLPHHAPSRGPGGRAPQMRRSGAAGPRGWGAGGARRADRPRAPAGWPTSPPCTRAPRLPLPRDPPPVTHPRTARGPAPYLDVCRFP